MSIEETAKTLSVFTNDEAAQAAGFESGTYYTSISDAIKAAQNGDTVAIFAGNYNEVLTNPGNKSNITIIGEKDENGKSLVNWTGGMTLDKSDTWNDITISNINFINDSADGTGTILSIKSGSCWNINHCSFDATAHDGGYGWNPIAFPSGGSTRGGYTISDCDFVGGSIATRLSDDATLGYALKVVNCNITNTNFNMQAGGEYDVIFEDNNIVIDYDLGREGKDNAFLVIKSDADKVNVDISGGTLTMIGKSPVDDKGWSVISLGDNNKYNKAYAGDLVITGVTIQNTTDNSFISNFSKAEDFTFEIDLSGNTFLDAEGNVVTNSKQIAEEYLNLKNGNVAIDYSNFKDADGNACGNNATMSHEDNQTEISYIENGVEFTYVDNTLTSMVAADSILYLNGEFYNSDLTYKAIKAASKTSQITDANVTVEGLLVGDYIHGGVVDKNISNSATLNILGSNIFVKGNEATDSGLIVGKDSNVAKKFSLILKDGTTITGPGSAGINETRVTGINVRKDGYLEISEGSSIYAQYMPIEGAVKVTGENSLLNIQKATIFGENSVVDIENGGKLELLGIDKNLYPYLVVGLDEATGLININKDGAVIVKGALNNSNKLEGSLIINQNGQVVVQGGSLIVDNGANIDIKAGGTLKVTGSNASTVKANIIGDAMQLDNGVLKDSEISGDVLVSGKSTMAGENKFSGNQSVIKVSGGTLTIGVEDSITGPLQVLPTNINGNDVNMPLSDNVNLWAGEDAYWDTYNYGTGLDNKGAGTIDIYGKVDVAQINANSAGQINVYDGATVKTTMLCVENGDMTKAGQMLIDTGATVMSTNVSIFNGGSISVKGDFFVNHAFAGIADAKNRLNVFANGNLTIEGGNVWVGDWGKLNVENGSSINMVAGTLTIENSNGANDFVLDGSLNMDSNSFIKVENITGNGTITIDVKDFSGIKKVIDITAENQEWAEGALVFKNLGEARYVLGEDGDVILVNVNEKSLYVDKALATMDYKVGTEIATGLFYGYNVFADITDATRTIVNDGIAPEIVIAAGKYGTMNFDGNVTLIADTAENEVASFDYLDKDPKQTNSNTVTFASGHFAFTANDNVLQPNDTYILKSGAIVDIAGQYLKSTITVEKGAVMNLQAMQNTVNTFTVKGIVNISNSGVYAKLAGNDGRTSGSMVVDGCDGEGIIFIDQKGFSVSGGFNSTGWAEAPDNSSLIITNGGSIKSNAWFFTNGTNGTITIEKGSSLIFTKYDDAANENTVLSNQHPEAGEQNFTNATGNKGTIKVLSNSTLDLRGDLGHLGDNFVNSGNIEVNNANMIANTIDNQGKITVAGGSFVAESVIGSKELLIENNAKVDIDSIYTNINFNSINNGKMTFDNVVIDNLSSTLNTYGYTTLSGTKVNVNKETGTGSFVSNEKVVIADNSVINVNSFNVTKGGAIESNSVVNTGVFSASSSAKEVVNFDIAGTVNATGNFTIDYRGNSASKVTITAGGVYNQTGGNLWINGGNFVVNGYAKFDKIGNTRVGAGAQYVGAVIVDGTYAAANNNNGKLIINTLSIYQNSKLDVVKGGYIEAGTLATMQDGTITVDNSTIIANNINNSGRVIIKGTSTVNVNSNINGTVIINNGAILSGSLSATNITVSGTVALANNTALTGSITSGTIKVTADNILNIKDNSLNATIVLADGDYSDDNFGNAELKGATKDTEVTLKASSLNGNKITNTKVNFIVTDIDSNIDIKTDIALSAIKSVNNFEVMNLNDIYFYNDNADNIFVIKKVDTGFDIVVADPNNPETTFFNEEMDSFNIFGDLSKYDVTMKAGKTTLQVANGQSAAIGNVIKSSQGGINNIAVGKEASFTVNSIQRMGNITVGKDGSQMTIKEAVSGTSNAETITIGDASIFNSKEINFAAGKATIKLGKEAVAKIDGNIIVDGANNSITLGVDAIMNISGNIINICGDNYDEVTGTVKDVPLVGTDIKLGKGAVMLVGNINEATDIIGLSSLTLANGVAEKLDKNNVVISEENNTIFVSGVITGTDKNNVISVGNYGIFTADSIHMYGGNDSIKVGNNSDFMIAVITQQDKYPGDITGVETIKVGNNSKFVANNIIGVNKLTFGNGSYDKKDDVISYAKLDLDGCIEGTAKNDNITLGNFNDALVSGVDLGLGNDTVKIGNNSTLGSTGNIQLGLGNDTLKIGNGTNVEVVGIANAETISLGATSTLIVQNNIENVNKLTLSNGAYNKKTNVTSWTMLQADDITGTANNDSITFGNYNEVELTGLKLGAGNDTIKIANDSILDLGVVDLGDGKDTLTIGKNSRIKVTSISGVEVINGQIGSSIWVNSGADTDVNFDDIDGSWNNLVIYDDKGELLDSGWGAVYGNEHDIYELADGLTSIQIATESNSNTIYEVYEVGVWDKAVGTITDISTGSITLDANKDYVLSVSIENANFNKDDESSKYSFTLA